MQWKSVIIDPSNDKEHHPLTGILVDMQNGSELMPFIFDDKGFLRSIVSLNHFAENEDYQKIVSIKTQYSSAKYHIALIKLLRYIKNKYISNMQVTDEGEYWESSSAERLEQLMEFLNQKLNYICDVLKGTEDQYSGIEDSDKLANKLEQIILRHINPSSTHRTKP